MKFALEKRAAAPIARRASDLLARRFFLRILCGFKERNALGRDTSLRDFSLSNPYEFAYAVSVLSRFDITKQTVLNYCGLSSFSFSKGSPKCARTSF
jgi:hypothetical protein